MAAWISSGLLRSHNEENKKGKKGKRRGKEAGKRTRKMIKRKHPISFLEMRLLGII
jgi:hypothetical protein